MKYFAAGVGYGREAISIRAVPLAGWVILPTGVDNAAVVLAAHYGRIKRGNRKIISTAGVWKLQARLPAHYR